MRLFYATPFSPTALHDVSLPHPARLRKHVIPLICYNFWNFCYFCAPISRQKAQAEQLALNVSRSIKYTTTTRILEAYLGKYGVHACNTRNIYNNICNTNPHSTALTSAHLSGVVVAVIFLFPTNVFPSCICYDRHCSSAAN